MFTRFLLLVIRFRTLVFLWSGIWAVTGLWIAWNAPVDVLPDLSENQVLVYTPWTDHNPPEIHSQITRPLSEFLRDIPGVKTVRGSSDVGFSLLYIIFDDSISFHEARQRVEQRLSQSTVKLPDGLKAQLAPEGIPTGQIVWYTVSGRETDLVELRGWQERVIAPQLSKVAGVAQVATVGGFQLELQIELDAKRLASKGLSFGDFERQLRNQLPQLSIGISQPAQTSEIALQVAKIEDQLLEMPGLAPFRLGDVSEISMQPAPRYGVMEKDGSEMVAGIVHLQAGANPLEVTQAVLRELQTIGDQLPSDLRLVPCYDRTRLISGAVSTVTRTLLEALIISTVCIVLIMRHFRTSLVITLTMPLAVLGPFVGMQVLSNVGMNLQVNIMSLAGIAISIGVLVDASVVIVENVTYQLKRAYGDKPIDGNTDILVANATAMVARPAVLSVMIMLISFLPIFTLSGIDGQLIRPLAWTKSLTLLSVIVFTVTLVPALCSVLIRGRVRSESESRIIRNVIRIYEPILLAVCHRPWPIILIYGGLLVAAAIAIGNDMAIRAVVVVTIGAVWMVVKTNRGRLCLGFCILLAALWGQSTIRPIGLAMRLPLNEGMVMDMPITIPRMNVSQASDDLKARNMQLCRFPEVQMVVGKAGRAETAFDPAPVDMIETMVDFRPVERWPRRRLMPSTAHLHAKRVVDEMIAAGLVEESPDEAKLLESIVESGLPRFDAMQRELCWNLLQSFEASLGVELATAIARSVATAELRNDKSAIYQTDVELEALARSLNPQDRLLLAQQQDANSIHIVTREIRRKLADRNRTEETSGDRLTEHATTFETQLLKNIQTVAVKSWSRFVHSENQHLYRRAGSTWTQIVVEELCSRQAIVDPDFQRTWSQILSARYGTTRRDAQHTSQHHSGIRSFSELAIIDPHETYDRIVRECAEQFDRSVWLWQHDPSSLTTPGGELDQAVQMPGWANVWTRPIQNRIDMLTTGVSSEIGIRVLGDDFEQVVAISDQIAEAIRGIPGAVDVISDPIRNKDYVFFDVDSNRVVNRSLDRNEVDLAILAAVNGILIAPSEDSLVKQTIPVRLKISDNRDPTSDRLLDTTLALRSSQGANDEKDNASADVQLVSLREVARIRHQDGPATIKSTNGTLSNYVRLNVRGRDASEVVQEARDLLNTMKLDRGIRIEWTGQFEHAARTRRSMIWMLPVCFMIIAALLYWTFRDLADAMLMLLSVPGALAGAILMQWLLGYPFSLAVGVGYIACFGMAAATSMVMIIYLRQAIEDAGGLKNIPSLDELQTCIVKGAVHRLRPKLLTEATMILSLTPLLWSTGVGADVICPMAAPVLGGILVADEVVDLLIPAVFFATRRRRWLQLTES